MPRAGFPRFCAKLNNTKAYPNRLPMQAEPVEFWFQTNDGTAAALLVHGCARISIFPDTFLRWNE